MVLVSLYFVLPISKLKVAVRKELPQKSPKLP